MIARIIMSEHPNEKDLEHFSSDHKDAVKDGFLANTQFSISVQTSPTSLLVISGYEDQKSADSNLEARQKWFDERKGKYSDTFYYEGEIKTQMKGGGKQLLSLQTEVNTDTEVVPTNLIDKEMEIIKAEITNSGKPAEMAEKISKGKISKFLNDNSLLNQIWIMDPKKKVSDVLKESSSDKPIKVLDFIRYKVGEGI